MSDTGRILRIEALTAAAFAPFGDVVEAHDGVDERVINYGHTTAWYDLADVDVAREGGRPLVRLFETRARSLPLRVRVMERHPLGSQMFVPVRAKRWLIIVAPPGDFDAAALRAFIVGDEQGVNLRPGVWHHYSLALDEPARFLVIDREGPGVHTEEHELDDDAPVVVDFA